MSSANPLRVVVIDDQPAIRRSVELLLEPMEQFILVGSCSSVQEALVAIPASNPDLLLLDINLGDGTGFDLLNSLPDRKFKVIFLTAYEEFALKAIKTGALDYLLKPIVQSEFEAALLKVSESAPYEQATGTASRKSLKEHSRLVLSSQQHLEVVELKDIIYCQSDSGYTTFYLTNKKVVTSKYLKEYEEFLPEDQFLRTHQSYIVNISFIDRYHRDGYILLQNGVKIPVATRRKEMIKKYLKGP